MTVSGYYVDAGQTVYHVETVNGRKSDCQIMLDYSDSEKPSEANKATFEGHEFGTLSSALETGNCDPANRQNLSTRFKVSSGILSGLLADVGSSETASTIGVADIGKKLVVIGTLGLPLGTTVTISGRYVGAARLQFDVERLNGKKCDYRLMLDYPEIEKWREGTRATVEGHEFGMLSAGFEFSNSTLNDPRNKEQALDTRFKITRVLALNDGILRDGKHADQ